MKTKRRVYMLPVDLCERIDKFASDHGFDSEVAAARKLLEAGLDYTEEPVELAARFREMHPEDAARIACGHPKVVSITRIRDGFAIMLAGGDEITLQGKAAA